MADFSRQLEVLAHARDVFWVDEVRSLPSDHLVRREALREDVVPVHGELVGLLEVDVHLDLALVWLPPSSPD